MQQEPLFYEDINDAIRATVQAIGGMKRVGHDLWPTMTPEAAGNRLRDSLNPDRRERLNPDELLAVMKMGRSHGMHIIAGFLCAEAGYSQPLPIDPADERAELQRQVIAAAADFKSLVSRLERVSITAVLPAGRRS